MSRVNVVSSMTEADVAELLEQDEIRAVEPLTQKGKA